MDVVNIHNRIYKDGRMRSGRMRTCRALHWRHGNEHKHKTRVMCSQRRWMHGCGHTYAHTYMCTHIYMYTHVDTYARAWVWIWQTSTIDKRSDDDDDMMMTRWWAALQFMHTRLTQTAALYQHSRCPCVLIFSVPLPADIRALASWTFPVPESASAAAVAVTACCWDSPWCVRVGCFTADCVLPQDFSHVLKLS